jgi:GH18 family chitinase
MKPACSSIAIAPLALATVFASWIGAEEPARRDKGGRDGTSFCVVGYLPDYRMESFGPDQAKLVTDLIYFAADAEPAGGLNVKRLPPKDFQTLREIKEKHPVRLLLCAGGWGRSRGFAELAASPRARQRFAAGLVAFCADNHFDGADLDWEHPETEAERKDYAALLVEIKKAFAPRRLLLTVAMAGWQELPADGFDAVDRIHLKAYDAEGRHATPEFAAAEVARLLKKGAPASKICLGLPCYGRGVDQPAKVLTYAELVHKHRPAADRDEVDGIYFNGRRTVERKTKYALEHKLAGVMVWELGQDTRDEYSLLRVIHRVVSASGRGRQ